MSGLLRQPYRFEGLSPVDDIFEPNYLPVAVRNDERRRYVDLDAAPSATKSRLSQRNHAVANAVHEVVLGVEQVEASNIVREELPEAGAAAIGTLDRRPPGDELSIFSEVCDPGLEVTALECFKVAQEGIHIRLRQGRGL